MKSPIEAVAVFNEKKIKGIVHFKEDITNNTVMIEINISGLIDPNIKGDWTTPQINWAEIFNIIQRNINF